MNLNQQTVSAGGNGSQGNRGNQVPFPGAVAGVSNDWQVTEPLDHRDRRHVQREPGQGLKTAYASLAEHHLAIAPGQHVFRRQEPLLVGCGKAPFDHYRHIQFAHGVQQIVVLHITSANLQDVGVFGHGIEVLDGHHFGNDRQAGFLLGCLEQFQPFNTHASKTVRGSAGLECAATEDFGSGGLDRLGGRDHLVFVFHRARPGHNHRLRAANDGLAHLYRSVFWMKLTTGQFVGIGDADHLHHAGD